MKFTLFNTGRTDASYLREGIEDYSRRIRHFIDFTIVDVPGVRSAGKSPPETIRRKEGENIKKVLRGKDFVILLDEKGIEMGSRKFAEWLNKIQSLSYKQIAFVTGGAYGFSEDIHKLADLKISLSKMTFTHQMVRMIFTEQLYRACMILKGMNYHND
ncbi:MAG: 23S rRNA (pseudouridine(1915)-N(3))-methyltransferase RlmH [Bacteroidales bacterium]